ncbi:hypothetical protein [Candidatus Harpocratesius sp.]
MNSLSFLVIFISILAGIIFILIEHHHHYFRLHDSFLASISISYFFLVVLPEISNGIPEYPLHLKNFEFLFILVGFITEHLSEKYILQTVEKKSQDKMRNLLKTEENLKIVSNNIEISISNEAINEHHDEDYIKELALTALGLKKQENALIKEILVEKERITKHINKNLDELRWITQFIHHFLIGLLLFFLLQINLISGFLFFFFASFMALITKRTKKMQVFSDLDIEIEWHEISKKWRFFLSSATLIGIFCSILLNLFLMINLETIFLFYSFVSGFILYKIIRKELPEKEKGKPLLFLAGFVIFALFVLVFNYIEHKLL